MTAYKMNFRGHLRSSWFTFVFILISLIVAFYIEGKSWSTFGVIASISIIPLLMIASPSIYLHISYFLNDYGVRLVIDDERQKLIIFKGSEEYTYCFTDIVAIERHIGIYYRNRIDNASRRFAPWTDYGYLLLKFNDTRQFRITSLTIDVHNPPIELNHTRFRFIPFLKTENPISQTREAAKISYDNQVAYFKSNFKNQTEQQLQEKILNKHTYEPEAVEAAKQLLEQRFKKSAKTNQPHQE